MSLSTLVFTDSTVMLMIWILVLVGSLLQVSASAIKQGSHTLPTSDILPNEDLSIISDYEKRNAIQRIEENLSLDSDVPEHNMLYRLDSSGTPTDEIREHEGEWTQNKPLYLFDESSDFGDQEQSYDASSSVNKPSSPDFFNLMEDMRPNMWKRRLQMKGPGLLGSKLKGSKSLIGYSGSRNKGLVLSIDLGIKALRDAILHAKVQRKNRKLQAQAQRNMKMLHNIGKRRATEQANRS